MLNIHLFAVRRGIYDLRRANYYPFITKLSMKLRKLSTVSLALLLSAGFMSSSCDKVKDLVKVNIPMQTVEYKFDIPARDLTGEFTVADFNVRFNVDSAIKANASQFSTANIRTVKVSSVNISTSNGTNENHIGAFTSCSVKGNSNVNTEFTTLASKASIPDNFVQSIDLDVEKDKELKSYFNNPVNFSYVITANNRRSIPSPLKATIKVKFDVEVGP